jgi:hypothetical protein
LTFHVKQLKNRVLGFETISLSASVTHSFVNFIETCLALSDSEYFSAAAPPMFALTFSSAIAMMPSPSCSVGIPRGEASVEKADKKCLPLEDRLKKYVFIYYLLAPVFNRVFFLTYFFFSSKLNPRQKWKKLTSIDFIR